jgi:hypothetical protein
MFDSLWEMLADIAAALHLSSRALRHEVAQEETSQSCRCGVVPFCPRSHPGE